MLLPLSLCRFTVWNKINYFGRKPKSFRLHTTSAQCSNKGRDYRALIDKYSRKIVIFFYDKHMHLQIFQIITLKYSYKRLQFI